MAAEGKPTTRGIVKELYYSSALSQWDLTIGRRVTSWGVGYGFRPLDVIQQQNLQSTDVESLGGVNQLIAERYWELSAAGIYLINPGEPLDTRGSKQPALIGRYFSSLEEGDWQAVLRYSDEHGLQGGLGGIKIVNDALELHSSLLYSPRYSKSIHSLAGQSSTLLATVDPWRERGYEGGLRIMVGANWTWSERDNLIVEYWHDDFALSRDEWQALFTLAGDQRGLHSIPALESAIHNNLAWSSRALQANSLMQKNLLLRWQHEGAEWQPAAALLITPDDGGRVTTLSLERKWQGLSMDAGLRLFDGPADSAYGQMTRERELFITLYSEF